MRRRGKVGETNVSYSSHPQYPTQRRVLEDLRRFTAKDVENIGNLRKKGKGELSDDFSEAWYHLERTPWKRSYKKEKESLGNHRKGDLHLDRTHKG